MIKQEIENLIKKETGKQAKIDCPVLLEFGDYSTNIAQQEKLNPQELALRLEKSGAGLFEKIEVKNGFINFFLNKEYLQSQVADVLKQGDKFGALSIGKSKNIQVEFISANPTGPLTLGNGRGGFCGDVLANVLVIAGYKVEREYYINDRGVQIKALGHSVLGDEEAVYKGDYIKNLELDLVKFKKTDDAEKIGEKASKIILKDMIKPIVKRMGIKYDKWFSEKKELYDSGKVDKILEHLKKNGLVYEKEGALWFSSTKFGDDKDRVLVKADGEKTYLASDAAYIKNKFERGFHKIIYFWGADHHGYVGRMLAMVEALGYKKEQAQFIVMQLVRLFRDGKEVRMSKRAGVYITLDELLDEVSVDVARFFFLSRAANTHLNFDLNLAKEQSEKNPVFYVQYAYARICSILAKAQKVKLSIINYQLLNHQSELGLIKQIIKLSEVIEDTAGDYQIQRLPKYATDLATAFHKFYTDCRVIDEKEAAISQARLALAKATQVALKNILDIMGIKAPTKM